MKRILFLHGWAGTANDWNPVRAALPGNLCTECPDAGYLGREIPWSRQRPDLVVGYSLGCLDALEQPELVDVPWIAVNGFTRFCAGPGFPDGVPPRILHRMQKRLSEDTRMTVTDFLARIGAPCPDDDIHYNHKTLALGLNRLLCTDKRPARPVLALAGEDDPLVSVPHSHACFGDKTTLVKGGGHRLIDTHTQAVAQAISRIARS